MKKILAIVVSCVYLAITSGLVLQIHYCMDKQVGSSVKFAEVNTHTCTVCGMQNAKNKCCHDEVKFIKLQDVHKQATADYTIAPPPAVSQEFDLINTPLYAVADSAAIRNNAPPDDDDGQPSLFIFNHFFRI
ncbi:MAG: hypothetical protein ABJB86_24755 [Bacteroidota bacterium]